MSTSCKKNENEIEINKEESLNRFTSLQKQIAEKAIKTGDCSTNVTKEYSEKLRQRVQSEMKTRYFFQQSITRHKWLMDVLAFVSRRKFLMRIIKNWYYK